MIPDNGFTGERDEQGHLILSATGLACIRECVNAHVRGEKWPGVSVRRCGRHVLDSRFVITHSDGPGERMIEVVIEVAEPAAVITVLLAIIDEPGTEAICVSLDAILAPVSNIESQLGEVQAVASDRCRGVGIERESRTALKAAERSANRACDLLREVVSNPLNWRPISAGAQLYAVAEVVVLSEASA